MPACAAGRAAAALEATDAAQGGQPDAELPGTAMAHEAEAAALSEPGEGHASAAVCAPLPAG